jgi:hypothetical protein
MMGGGVLGVHSMSGGSFRAAWIATAVAIVLLFSERVLLVLAAGLQLVLFTAAGRAGVLRGSPADPCAAVQSTGSRANSSAFASSNSSKLISPASKRL